MARAAGAGAVAVGLVLANSPFSAAGQLEAPVPCATKPAPPTTGATISPPLISGPDVWSFVSEPGLHPLRADVRTQRPGTAPGQIFLGPYNFSRMVGQTGALMNRNPGDPLFFRPLPFANLQDADVQAQTYHDRRTGRRQPVLTFWQGTITIPPAYTNLPAGAPQPGGCYYLYDNHYRLLKTVFARNGFDADFHEFLLTSRGTALFIASKAVPMDLTPYGGPANGAIEDHQVQEVDLATGKLVFFWDMLRHVNPADSELPASSASSSGGVWDAFHLNSIDEGPDGDLLVSARNMWALYDLSRRTGRINWQFGGKKSDFTFGPGADFFWQHDARFRPGKGISMFDDGCCATSSSPPQQESHGLILDVDFRHRRATAGRTYFHDPALFAASQGDLQALPNGNQFLGWGQESYFSEYTARGNTQGNGRCDLLYDVMMPGSDVSYRAFRYEWTGLPDYPPNAAARAAGGRSLVFASWNGSTETVAWQVLAGPAPDALSVVVGHARRSGFETVIPAASRGPYFEVRALDAAGKVIGTSRVVELGE